jgi:hypothetical protein
VNASPLVPAKVGFGTLSCDIIRYNMPLLQRAVDRNGTIMAKRTGKV